MKYLIMATCALLAGCGLMKPETSIQTVVVESTPPQVFVQPVCKIENYETYPTLSTTAKRRAPNTAPIMGDIVRNSDERANIIARNRYRTIACQCVTAELIRDTATLKSPECLRWQKNNPKNKD